MQNVWKKAGIFLGHAICILVLIYSYADTNELFHAKENGILAENNLKTEENGLSLEESANTVTATSTALVIPTPTIIPVPMTTSTPIDTPTPTVVLSPTATCTPILSAIPEPTVTPTVETLPTKEPTPTVIPVTSVPVEVLMEERENKKSQVLQNIADGMYVALDNKKSSWWFRRKENQVPSGSGEAFKINDYQGFYCNTKADNEDKVVYLTIDCGYGSENTAVILDVLKKHDVKVTFFITGYFLNDSPKDAIRMVEEGHTVANHSLTHADLTKLSDQEIYDEIVKCEDAFYKLTGTPMAMYFRPPEGSYSKRTMQITEDLGYKTIYWSLAYRDFDRNNQPGKEYVLDHFSVYHHNGAIPLMHNDSDSNMEAMDELLTYLKEQGYRFGTLEELD